MEGQRAHLEAQLVTNQQELDAARQRTAVLNKERSEAERELKELEARLFFSPKLPACVRLSIMGELRKRTAERAACVCREWRRSVETAKGLGMYDVKLLTVAVGGHTTVVCSSEGELFTFGKGEHGVLGHGGQENEPVPRLVEALAGKKVVGAAAGCHHSAVWTESGELFIFGRSIIGAPYVLTNLVIRV